MKGGTVQITWHGSDPVLTLDFHRPSGLLATGGADHDIKLWTLYQADDANSLPTATFGSSLSYHTAAVNVLRFSSMGDQLASGADGGEILLWRLVESSETANTWKVSKTLRFHVKDVLDMEWSPDGTSLVSGSVDNTVIVWDTIKGIPQQVLKDHMHYVQGVAWDPAGQFVASISGDRTCRIYSNKPQSSKSKVQDKNTFSCQNVLVKAEVQKQDDDTSDTKVAAAKHHLFHDETLPSFFRRLAWSPDGSFLLVPSGIHKFSPESVQSNTAYIISRKDLSRPAVQLPGASKPTVAVRFCPVIFSLRSIAVQKSENDSSNEVFKLPYRLVFAVATLNSVFVYDTQSAYPLAVLAGLHYAAITDIAWSWDAKFLAVSSQDGFCTLVAFDDGELGSPLPLNEIPSHIANYLPERLLAKEKEIVDNPGKFFKIPEDKIQADTVSPQTGSENKVSVDSVQHAASEKEDKCSESCLTVQTLSAVGTARQASETEQPSSMVTMEMPLESNSQTLPNAQVRPVKLRRIIPTAITVDSVPTLLQSSEASKPAIK